MSIDLNNTQFRRFVRFADEADSYTAIAQLGDVAPGQDASAPDALVNRKIVAKEQFDWVGNRLRLSRSRSTNNATRELFLNTVLKMCNVSSVEQLPESVRNALLMKDYGKGKPLTARRILAVSDALKAEVARRAEDAAQFAELLGLKGKSGGKIAGVCVPGSGLTEVEDPKAELQRRMNKIGTDYMHKNALTGVFTQSGDKVEFNDPDIPLPAFDVDFKRSTVVNICGQTYAYPKGASDEEKVKALEDVHDAFVRFITDDPKAKFKTASRDVKMQANILMRFAYQGLDAIVMTGVSYAFDANISSDRFQCTGRGQRTQSYEFSKDENGNIKFNYYLGLNGLFIIAQDENGNQTNNIDKDGTMEYKMELKLSKNELERYGKVDWENSDRGPVNKAFEITRKMDKGWVTNLAKTIPEDKKLQFDDFKISFNFHSDKFDNAEP